jgi:hypothetical protein
LAQKGVVKMINPPPDRYQLADVAIANGVVTMIAAIVRILEEKAIVPVGEFAASLEEAANAAEINSPFPPGMLRFDLLMMRQTATTLRQQKERGGWKPIVIQGGLSEKSDQENSD